MVRMSTLADCLKTMTNAEKRGKRQALIRPASSVIIRVLKVMQKHGYIGDFEVVDNHRSNKIVVELNGRINKCGVVSPRYDVSMFQMEKWITNLLPSRQFGFLLLTTSKGIMDHEEARKKHTGGKILATAIMVLASDIDLLHPPAELEKQKHKLKRLVQSPNSFFMDVKCAGCFQITTVFSHSQTVVVCSSCSSVLCSPTGGRARLTEGCSFRRKGD